MNKVYKLYGNKLIAEFMSKQLQMGSVSDFKGNMDAEDDYIIYNYQNDVKQELKKYEHRQKRNNRRSNKLR